HQKTIDAVRGAGGFAVLNHPNWGTNFCHWPQEKLESLLGYAGIEIYNGVVSRLEGSALATDRWDILLSKGRRCWGFAHDDCHRPKDIGKGWVCVQVDGPSPEAICRSLAEGRFYASTGVEIREITAADGRIHVKAPGAHCVKFVGRWGMELLEVEGEEAEYTPTGDELYVRVECLGCGGKTAWSQPFWIGTLPEEHA
ncbi:MAG: PHP-associated domain-containing protein, partial [Armatimonadota bacterium]